MHPGCIWYYIKTYTYHIILNMENRLTIFSIASNIGIAEMSLDQVVKILGKQLANENIFIGCILSLIASGIWIAFRRKKSNLHLERKGE